jgi:hypothetical protein
MGAFPEAAAMSWIPCRLGWSSIAQARDAIGVCAGGIQARDAGTATLEIGNHVRKIIIGI